MSVDETKKKTKIDPLEKLEDGEHNVVDVAKTRRLVSSCVMQSTSPVDRNVALLIVELDGAECRRKRRKSQSL